MHGASGNSTPSDCAWGVSVVRLSMSLSLISQTAPFAPFTPESVTAVLVPARKGDNSTRTSRLACLPLNVPRGLVLEPVREDGEANVHAPGVAS